MQTLIATVHRPVHTDLDAAKAFGHVSWKIAIFAYFTQSKIQDQISKCKTIAWHALPTRENTAKMAMPQMVTTS
jgi:hypothetical protein